MRDTDVLIAHPRRCHALTIARCLAEVSEIICVRAHCLGIAGVAIGTTRWRRKKLQKSRTSKTVELPTAKELMKQIAQKEAEKASEYMRQQSAAEREKKALIERFTKPSGVSDEEALRRAMVIIQRAASNGLTEVQVLRFPNSLCTDGGRAINNLEKGWENTLTGLAQEMYRFWDQHLRPKGYRLRCQIVDFPKGMPGDVGITLSWADK